MLLSPSAASQWLPLLAALLLASGLGSSWAAELHMLPGGQAMEVEVYPGHSRWKLLPHLWTHKTVNITCPGNAVRATAGHSAAVAILVGRRITCGGWMSLPRSLR